MIKILIVDDHFAIRTGLKSMLNHFEKTQVIGECKDGSSVLPFLKSNEVDVIFMDINMPIMNGFEATVLIKEQYPSIKIITFSSHNDQYSVDKSYKCGANAFISKEDIAFDSLSTALKKVGC